MESCTARWAAVWPVIRVVEQLSTADYANTALLHNAQPQ